MNHKTIQSMKLQKHIDAQLVRYSELMPGVSAFIDAHTPGSHLKDNYCIIGSGVAENDRQPVHIRQTAGFNIGAAGQPPGIKNSLHSHNSAEIFIVFRGQFRFYWGNDGEYDSVLTAGDIISIPVNLFRGFEVVGRDYGFMFSVLGGDDAGGGVTWHPQVIKNSQGHGLYLRADGTLIDTHAGDPVPQETELMPLLTDQQMQTFDQYSVKDMSAFIALFDQYQPITPDFDSANFCQYALTGSPEAAYDFSVKSHDGVSILAYALQQGASIPKHVRQEKQVLINFSGDTLVTVNCDAQSACILLTPGDVFNVPEHAALSLRNQRGDSLTYLVLGSDQPERPEVCS